MPELINQSPYEKGWLAEVDVADWAAELRALLDPEAYVEVRVRRALQAAQKYSLVANSVKAAIVVEPDITVVHQQGGQT